MRRIWSTATTRGRVTVLLGAVVAAAGALWHYPVLAGLGLCLLGLVAADLVIVLRAAPLQVRRAIAPHVVVRHGPCQGTLHVSGAQSGALARVDAQDLVDGTPVPVPLTGGPRALAASVTYQVPTPRRGLLTVGPAQLHRRGLTGMAERTDRVGGTDQVRVLPRPIPITGLPSGRRQAVTGGDDSAEQGGTDLVGLHEYAMGEDLRRLHWATSARTGTLMVREDAEPSEAHVLVLLDDRSASYSDTWGAELFEEAVELTAALCRIGVEAGGPLRFRTVSGRHEVVIPGSATRQPRREARELEWLLAEIQPVAHTDPPRTGSRALDIVAVVTGDASDLCQLAVVVADAPTRVVAVVEPAPAVALADESGVLVLRGRTSTELAAAWDAGVHG